jgi:hypothetical protein
MTSLSRVPADLQGYLAWENCQPDRYELIAGAVRPREGGTRAQDLIAATIGALLHAAVGRRCYVHGSRLKVVSSDGMVAYPDVLVRCGPLGGFKRSSQHGLFRLIVGTGPGPRREFSSLASFEVCH